MEYIVKRIDFNKIEDYNKVCNIAVCTDNNVVQAMGVLLFSILKNNQQQFSFHIFFRGEIDSVDLIRIEDLSNLYDVTIVIYFINDSKLSFLYSTNNISITSYYRLFMPYILQSLNILKVLYLDVDMICVAEISEIFSKKLGNKIAYVTKSFTSNPGFWKKYCYEIGMSDCNYFNAGMMLINVPMYIKEDIGNKAISLASKGYKYMDQDVLNILLENKIVLDDQSCYNCTMSVTNDNYEKDKVKIIHFTGNKKPWKLYTSIWGDIYIINNEYSWKYYYYKLWREYAEMSPWKNIRYDYPKEYTEWRYMAKMYKKIGRYVSALNAYKKYIILKYIHNEKVRK